MMRTRPSPRVARAGVIRRAARAFTLPTITPKTGGWIA